MVLRTPVLHFQGWLTPRDLAGDMQGKEQSVCEPELRGPSGSPSELLGVCPQVRWLTDPTWKGTGLMHPGGSQSGKQVGAGLSQASWTGMALDTLLLGCPWELQTQSRDNRRRAQPWATCARVSFARPAAGSGLSLPRQEREKTGREPGLSRGPGSFVSCILSDMKCTPKVLSARKVQGCRDLDESHSRF